MIGILVFGWFVTTAILTGTSCILCSRASSPSDEENAWVVLGTISGLVSVGLAIGLIAILGDFPL